MGFVFLDRYDVNACAEQCNTRGADPKGGACQYFNIWRALVKGVTSYQVRMSQYPFHAFTNYFQWALQDFGMYESKETLVNHLYYYSLF